MSGAHVVADAGGEDGADTLPAVSNAVTVYDVQRARGQPSVRKLVLVVVVTGVVPKSLR